MTRRSGAGLLSSPLDWVLAALTMLCLAAGSGALAAPPMMPPPVTAIDANNVDLMSGKLVNSAPSVSIGSSGSGLGVSFAGFDVMDSNSWRGRYYSVNGTTTVSVGNASEEFSGTTPVNGGSSTLHSETIDGRIFYIWTTGDGTRHYYDTAQEEYSDRPVYDSNMTLTDTPEPEPGAFALTKVVKPDGEVITINNGVAEYPVETHIRYGLGEQGPEFCAAKEHEGWIITVECRPCDENGEPEFDSWEYEWMNGCFTDDPDYEYKIKRQSVQLISVFSSLGWAIYFTPVSGGYGVIAVNGAIEYCDGVTISCGSLNGPKIVRTSSLTNLGGGVTRSTQNFADALSNSTAVTKEFTLKTYDYMYPRSGTYTTFRGVTGKESTQTPRGALGAATFGASNCGVDPNGPLAYQQPDIRTRVTQFTLGSSTWNYTFSCASPWGQVTGTVTHSPATGAAGTRTVVSNGQWVISNTDELGRTTSYEYYSAGQLKKVIRPEGNTSTGGYTQYTYNSVGDVTEVREVPVGGAGNSSTHLVTSATYATCDAQTATNSNFRYCHKPLTVTDPNGVTTTFTYAYEHGGVLTETMPSVGGVAAQTRYAYQQFTPQMKNSSGVLVNQPQVWRLVSIKKCMTAHLAGCAGTADEQVTEIGYSGPHVLPVSKTAKRGDGSLSQTVTTAYDSYGDVTSVDGPLAGTDDKTFYFYDAVRRKIGEIGPDPDGGGARPRQAVRTTYGVDGQVERVELGHTSGTSYSDLFGGSPTLVVREKTETTYSASTGRPEVGRRFDGSTVVAVTQTNYDANLRPNCVAQRMVPANWASVPSTLPDACVAQTPGADGYDRIVKTTYDVTGKVLKTTSGYGLPSPHNSIQRDDRVDTYSATDGTLTSAADGNGNLTTYEYDAHLRLKKTRFPNASGGGSSTTDYEELVYDGGRVSELRLRGYHADASQKISTQYDAAGRVSTRGGLVAETFAYNNLGAVTSHTRGGKTSDFGYNSLGWLLWETSALGTVTYGNDAYGRRDAMAWPDSFSVTYDYDNSNALTAIKQGGSAIVTFGYDDAGRRSTITRPNGVTTTYAYDGVSRLSGLTQNLASTAHDLTATFAYSPASQLKSRVFSNDLYETSVANVTRPYVNNGLNQVTSVGATPLAYTYDVRGNLWKEGPTSAPLNTYTYDAENRLTGLASSGVPVASLSYDAQGRLYEIVGSTTTRQLYDGVNMIAEYNGSNAVQRRFVHGPGTDEPLVWYEGSGTSTPRWLIANQQGSIISVTDSTGAAIATNTYDEYGVPGGSNIGRFQYTGQQWLGEVGLYHYKARAYSPALGRFMQTDPIGYKDGMNWYAYVGNDPLNQVDPDGQQATCGDGTPFCASRTDEANREFERRDPQGAQFARGQAIEVVGNLVGLIPTPWTRGAGIGLRNQGRELQRTAYTDGTAVPVTRDPPTQTGSYTNTHESGMTYSGKGNRERSQVSGRRVERETGDPHTATEWRSAETTRQAFKDESVRIDNNGGASSNSNYNKVESPGKRYRDQDGRR